MDAVVPGWREYHRDGQGVWGYEIDDEVSEERFLMKVQGFLVEDS